MSSEVNGILVAAHELKQPWAEMRQLALTFDLADNPAEQRHICQQMVDLSDKALRQVNDLAKIARLENGLFTMEPVSARAVVDDVVRELVDLHDFDRRDLDLCFPSKSPLITANRELLHSVIFNFCTNAEHYPGNEAISRITIASHHDRLRIGVRDFGPALPIDLWRALQYGWIDRPTAIPFRPGSSGLGLYIASRFTDFMHGQIGATRHRDGTSFFVELPISRQRSFFDL